MNNPIPKYLEHLNEYTMDESEISNIIYDRYIEQVEDMQTRCNSMDKKRNKIENQENYALCILDVHQRAFKMWNSWAKREIRKICKVNPLCLKRAATVYNKIKRENTENVKKQMNTVQTIRQKYNKK